MPLLALNSMCIRECVRSFYFYAAVVKAFNQAAGQGALIVFGSATFPDLNLNKRDDTLLPW